MAGNYYFSDLVLLVGSNPLPNYVVAKYFWQHNKNLKRIWLIYSEKNQFDSGTKKYADNLEEILGNEKSKDYPYIKVNPRPISDISRADVIADDIRLIFEEEENIEEIHLNYTGGTKAMSVHIYRTLEEMWQDNFSASYLDARYYQLRFDGNSDLDTNDLRKTIGISWGNLFKLHGHELQSEQNKRPDSTYSYCPKNLVLAKILEHIGKMAEAGKLKNLKDFSTAKYKSKIWEKSPFNIWKEGDNEKFSGVEAKDIVDHAFAEFNPKGNVELFELLAVFPEQNRLVNDDGTWRYENFPVCSGKRDEEFVKFLEGKWYDAYVAWVLNKYLPDCEAIAGKKEWGFEVDVLVKNGYQICAISCGTSLKERPLKLKGLEVILRSRELGGDEARAVVATLFEPEQVNDLEKDLKAASRTGQQTFMVLGINDLAPETLSLKIKEFLGWK
jgi:hypothetical protein